MMDHSDHESPLESLQTFIDKDLEVLTEHYNFSTLFSDEVQCTQRAGPLSKQLPSFQNVFECLCVITAFWVSSATFVITCGFQNAVCFPCPIVKTILREVTRLLVSHMIQDCQCL